MAQTRGLVLGDSVWVNQVSKNEFDIPIGGVIVTIESKRIKIRDDDGIESYVANEQIHKTMHVTSVAGVEDMINLGDLQEYAILRNLHKRYKEKKIYTYTGSMLIAVNPYEFLPIYTNSLIHEYHGKKLEDLPPHVFAIGDNAYSDMIKTKKNQCIVISGESGAGKTESTKLILQYLASISGQHSWIEQQILEANPILEAFGNAKTIRNDNSSRFGKYIDIKFNKSGSIEGAKIEQYLLEKSRLVSQNEGERNYHIFYSLLAGISKDEKKRLELRDAEGFEILKGGKTFNCSGRDEAKEFSDILAAFKVLNFEDKLVSGIFELLAVILHLGNIKFKTGSSSHSESSEIVDVNLIDKLSKLLGVSKHDLSEALIKKTIFAHGDAVVSNLSKEQASESRHAFIKSIYGKMFILIVDKINDAIYEEKRHFKSTIGVLDIFGFENFNVNSFEQLCINYANENLQQFFVKHIFKLEQEYYTKEGIRWSNISFIDNQEVLDMLGMKPMNILALIDEESKFPNGTDFSMLTKMHSKHEKKTFYLKPKSDITPEFGVQHFAGGVFYEVPGFLEKNRDSFSHDLKKLILTSSNETLKNIFERELNQETFSKKLVTLSSQFRTSLESLMGTLNACHPFFVRCIKPNDVKKPQIFDRALCTRQLRYSGMMETAKIRQAGYPIRYTYKEFVDRFRHLGKNIPPSSKADCKDSAVKICNAVFKNNEDYQLGHSKVFLKHPDNENLEHLRIVVLEKYIVLLQKVIKGWIYRRRYLKLRAAAIVVQKHFRARGYRSKYLLIRNGYQRLQATIRTRQQTLSYVKTRRIVIRLQAVSRGYLERKNGQYGRVVAIIKQRAINEADLRKRGVKNYKEEADAIMQKYLADCSKEHALKQQEENDKAVNVVNKAFNDIFDSSSTTSIDEISPVLNDKPLNSPPEIDYPDLSEFNFRKYAATYFVKSVSHQFSKKPLKESLHDLPTPDDVIASQALWITLLRFMGDYPEPRFDNSVRNNEPVMTAVVQTLSRSFTNRKEYQDILSQEKKLATMKKTERQKLISMTLKRKNKLLEDVRQGLVEDTYSAESYRDWLHNRRTNNLEKLHFIIGHGILRAELRDEIFCMICKQLTHNPLKSSYARGWILLSLCVGCFPPSDRFINYLRAFIRSGPPGYAPYCEGRLNRTFQNGARTQPPSWLELMSTKNKDPITVNITLMDSSVESIEIDSATTSEEIMNQLASNLNIKDKFGFSLFISLFDKVMSLGSGGEHLLDAISQCEQYAKEQGQSEKNCPWRLFVRKEMFTPWHNPGEDPVATNLIYHQIIRGLKVGEYRCSEGDIATLIATQYYIENGLQMNQQILHTRIGEYLPIYIVKKVQSGLNDWENKIASAFSKLLAVKRKMPPEIAKEFIVRYAKTTWPILFSTFFEAKQLSGPKLPTENLIIAVNWTGIYMIDDQEQILLELTYLDIFFVTFENTTRECKFIFRTIRQEEYVFHTLDSKYLSSLIQYMIDGLKKRSTYCVAIQDYKHPTNPDSWLELRKGDLITLKDGLVGENLMTATWEYGECNGKLGEFPTEVIYILPTLTKPSQDVLLAFKKDFAINKLDSSRDTGVINRTPVYTLSAYAEEHFRAGMKMEQRRQSVLRAARRTSKEELWKYTNEPIHQPLLKKLLTDEETSKEACNIFTSILKYMEDLPAPKAKYSNEYTDKIFSSAIKNDMLKDEVYCQIVRQITFNRLALSEEKGWELLYLATGLFVPSKNLLIELQKILKSKNHPFIEYCLQRLQRTEKVGPRKFPPYSIEVEAIQHRSMQIFHKIYYPDDSDEAYEVDSMTRAIDLCHNIGNRLELASIDGFSLFIAIGDKVFSIPENAFFYDFLSELIDWMRATKPSWGSAAPIQAQYQVFFMKKLWVNTIPGKCPNSDQMFYYHQEVPKYLKGFHKCSKQDAVKLAAFILRARFDDSEQEVQQALQTGVKEFIPGDIIKAAPVSDWKKSIFAEYSRNKISVGQAKTAFLKTIHQWPTFGTTFFEVKQTTEPTYPDIIFIGINKHGVNIIHPQTKDILATHEYSELSNWSSGNTYFHLTIGNIMRKTKLLCETSQGYKMDDLISSYTAFLRKNQQTNEKLLL